MADALASLRKVFPTPVGMNRKRAEVELFLESVPHARGDEPSTEPPPPNALACSPRPWG